MFRVDVGEDDSGMKGGVELPSQSREPRLRCPGDRRRVHRRRSQANGIKKVNADEGVFSYHTGL